MRLAHRLILTKEKLGKPKELFANQLPQQLPALHAKVIASEKAGLIGSHNFVETGVKFGTAEIALLRDDPTFAQALQQLLLSQIELSESTVTEAALVPQPALA